MMAEKQKDGTHSPVSTLWTLDNLSKALDEAISDMTKLTRFLVKWELRSSKGQFVFKFLATTELLYT